MTWATLFDRADAIAPAISVAEVRGELEEYRTAVEAGKERQAVGTAEGEGHVGESDWEAGARDDQDPGTVTGSREGSIEGREDGAGTGSLEGSGDTADGATWRRGTSGPGDADDSDRPDPARVVADADVLAADLLVGADARAVLDHVRAHRWVDLVASDELLADGVAVVARLADAELARDWVEELAALRIRVTHPPGDHPGLASASAGRAAHLLTFDEGLSSSDANLALRDHVRVSVRTPHAFATLFDPERLYPAVVGGEYPGPDADPRV